jgi:stress-induced-phosphoprotein 1
MSKAAAQALKAAGNDFFKNKNYENAIAKYTEAIAADPSDVTFYSNRSACYAALNKWTEAAEDGRQCIIVDKTFVKGYFRAALGQQNMGNLDAASDYVVRGLGIEPSNADLKKMSREIDEAQRQKKVESSITTAEQQLASNDAVSAFKTVDAALRLDPNNERLKKLLARIKPLYDRAEKERVSTLDPTERIKEEGDNLYKASQFEKAINSYTKAIDGIKDKTSEIALKCYGNRAACYKQLSNFDGTIGDCTHILEYKPDDIKSLIRRAQAYEACERYKLALQDVRQVIAFGVDAAGKATYDLANGMQHRLNRVIAQLKNG